MQLIEAPTVADRAAWDRVPAAARDVWLARGEAALSAEWPAIPATAWLDYVRTGSRGAFDMPHFTRRVLLRDLAMAECLEGSGRFVDGLVDAAWSICEESSWTWPACLYMQGAGDGLPDHDEFVVDLGAAENGAWMATLWHLLAPALDEVSPLVGRRIAYEVRRRVLEPYLARDDFWWMSAVNNWHPWITGNVLTAALLLPIDDGLREAVVEKACRDVDWFLDQYPDDGGCDEGTTYWARAGANLFDLLATLELLPGRGGRMARPKVREIALFPVRMHIAGPWFVNFADGGPRPPLPGPLVWEFGRAVGSEELRGLGAVLTRRTWEDDLWLLGENLGRTVTALFGVDEILADAASITALADVWLPEIEVMTARERSDHTGFFVAAKAGHNDEVHNHNDVGNFLVFLDGSPVVVDAGVGPYTKDTFSERRYTIWTMQSGWHNVPVVNGVEQAHGKRRAARDVAYEPSRLAMELAAAYPDEAGIGSWRREVALDRAASRVQVADAWSLADAGEAHVALTLLTSGQVVSAEAGRIVVKTEAGAVVLTLEPPLPVAVDEVPEDGYVVPVSWPDGLRRLRFAGPVASQGRATLTIERES